MEFAPFPKIARFSREVIVTEKIDGTNAQILIEDVGVSDTCRVFGPPCIAVSRTLAIYAGSRTRLITPSDDNFGFARWVYEHADELAELGPGRHFGEWWGSGIQRGYGLPKGEKRFSLFNVSRWADASVRPACCHVVPTLARAEGLDTLSVPTVMAYLKDNGSYAAPGFMRPEGIVIFHAQGNVAFKKTFDKDDAGKGREPIATELTRAA